MSLLDDVITRVTGLVAGLSYYHKPTGALAPVQVVDSFLEPPGMAWVEAVEFPQVRVAEYAGAYSSHTHESSIVVVGGILTGGSIADGTRDIKLLAAALGGLTQLRSVGDYAMATPVKYYFGDTERGKEGRQPHPYHFVTFFVDFKSK